MLWDWMLPALSHPCGASKGWLGKMTFLWETSKKIPKRNVKQRTANNILYWSFSQRRKHGCLPASARGFASVSWQIHTKLMISRRNISASKQQWVTKTWRCKNMTHAVKSVSMKHGLSLQIDGDLGLHVLERGAWSEGTTGWCGCFLSPSIQPYTGFQS